MAFIATCIAALFSIVALALGGLLVYEKSGDRLARLLASVMFGAGLWAFANAEADVALTSGSAFFWSGLAVTGFAEERLDPALRAVPVRDVVVEEKLAEHDSRADVGERLEGEDPVRRLDLGREGGVVANDAVDDLADRLVNEREPDLLGVGHARIMPRREVA